MATVYKAYQPSADRFVAVKVIRGDLSRELELRQRFEREARTIARLEHPAILPTYDVGEHNGVPFLVMRYVEGGSLRDRLERFLRGRKDRFVLLKADRGLSYGTVVETLDLLNRMGIEGLGMVTDTSGAKNAPAR